MYFVISGFILALSSVIARAILYKKREFQLDLQYHGLLMVSLLGSVFGAIGFFLLTQALKDDTSSSDYSQILTVLSLLATAIVTGFFTFTFTEAADDECLIPSAISILFTALFYFSFASICFYVGKSTKTHDIPYVTLVIPFIMWVLLVINLLFDFWDYRASSSSTL